MPKLTQIEKAIAQIDGEIAVLQAAKQRLLQQQAQQPKKKSGQKPTLLDAAKATGSEG